MGPQQQGLPAAWTELHPEAGERSEQRTRPWRGEQGPLLTCPWEKPRGVCIVTRDWSDTVEMQRLGRGVWHLCQVEGSSELMGRPEVTAVSCQPLWRQREL